MAFWGSKKKRVVVVGLDGVPYPFVREMVEKGEFPHMGALVQEGSMVPMRSTVPCVSSVAWSSYMTGKNPGKHNIFGFVDRNPRSLEIFIPTSKDMRTETLWEALGKSGRRVLVINVPLTYPPRPVNGILVGCFLCTNIDKVSYPRELSQWLKESGYRIDVDAWRARESKEAFLKDLHEALQKRVEIALSLYEREKWDFFQLHIMETDRINHFFWDAWDDPKSSWREAFLSFYREVDRAVGLLRKKTDPNSEFVLLSDHGFCSVKKEFNLNAWLREKGWLKMNHSTAKNPDEIDPQSKAFSLIPGRIYLRRKEGEEEGDLRPLEEEILSSLPSFCDPETGERIIDRVYRRNEIYAGPFAEKGPDLVAVPCRGFDIKGGSSSSPVLSRSELRGMHTDDDAFLYLRGHSLEGDGARIVDVYPTLLRLMGIPPDGEVDGVSLIP